MWLHRKSGSVTPSSQITSYTTSIPLIAPPFTNTAIVSQSGGNFFISNFYLENPNGMNDYQIQFNTTNTTVPYRLVVTLNGTTIYTSPFEVTGSFNFNQQLYFTGEGTYLVSVQHREEIIFTSVTLTATGFTRVTGQQPVNYTDTLTAVNVTLQEEFEFVISEQIPDVTIIEFLTGLFKTFNLVAYVNDENTIVVRPLDAKSGTADYSYYTSADIDGNDAPVTYDISSYVDVTKSQVNAALPYKEINYQYEGLGTFLAKQHVQLSGTGWGTLNYIGGTNSDGTGGVNYNATTNTYKVSVPFEHMKYERMIDGATGNTTTIQWGYSVNENQQPYIGKPLIFYAVHQSGQGTTPINFLTNNTQREELSSYNVPSNSLHLDPADGKQNINFSLELNEYTGGNGFTETLFNDYHSEYIIDIFNQSRRITKVDAFLPLRILYNFKLNDTFRINSRDYIINSITTNLQSGKSTMELLNVVINT
jgi:hypothetical protein